MNYTAYREHLRPLPLIGIFLMLGSGCTLRDRNMTDENIIHECYTSIPKGIVIEEWVSFSLDGNFSIILTNTGGTRYADVTLNVRGIRKKDQEVVDLINADEWVGSERGELGVLIDDQGILELFSYNFTKHRALVLKKYHGKIILTNVTVKSLRLK